ncbi:MAG: ribonuclease [Rhodocyclaceae bacterium]|nr:ribonuclease [Rhodocyclaceae bacterium]
MIRLARVLCLLAACLAVLVLPAAEAREARPAPPVALAELPTEARQTLGLIERGGPFPYRRDGVTFGNFEKRLPLRDRGYYREYTVPTPGSRDRGARRIVAGESGERYYTDDHYRSFRRIVP